MNYKKLLSLLAVSTFALAACDTNEEPADPDTDEEATDEGSEDAGSGQSAHDIIDGIEGNDLGYTAAVELEMGGTWTTDGRIFDYTEEGAIISGTAVPVDAEQSFVFIIQDGEVIDKPEVGDDGSFSFEAEIGEYVVGADGEDLYEVGDSADVEEIERTETAIVVEAEEEPADDAE